MHYTFSQRTLLKTQRTDWACDLGKSEIPPTLFHEASGFFAPTQRKLRGLAWPCPRSYASTVGTSYRDLTSGLAVVLANFGA